MHRVGAPCIASDRKSNRQHLGTRRAGQHVKEQRHLKRRSEARLHRGCGEENWRRDENPHSSIPIKQRAEKECTSCIGQAVGRDQERHAFRPHG